MEIKIGIEELQEIFSLLGNVVRLKEEDITSMVLMYTKNDKVYFKGSNQFSTIIIESKDAKILKAGKILFKLQDLKGYITKFIPLIEDYGTENFHFIIENEVGFLKTKTLFKGNKPAYRKFKFATYNYDIPTNVKDFPEPQFILNSTILKLGIRKVLHCVNPEDIRKALAGVNIKVSNDKVVFVGSDGVKLSEVVMDINADIMEKSYIFKYDFAYILKNVLADNAQVFINIEADRAYIKSNNIYLIGGVVLDELYPDYESMFNVEHKLSVPLEDFVDTVEIAIEALDSDDNNRLSLHFNENRLTVKNKFMQSTQDFDFRFEDELLIDVNGLFLSSLIRTLNGQTLEILFTPGVNYVIFKSVEYPNQTVLLTLLRRR